MADSVGGGLLGGGEESEAAQEVERPAEAGGQGLAAGMAMDLARTERRVADRAADFLQEQTRLTQQMADQSAAEFPSRLRQLQKRAIEGKLRRVGQRIRIGLQFVSAAVVAMIAFGLCVMLYDALTSRSVVVDPFDAPPALAARGLTGKVVAGGLLDELARLQAATRVSTRKRQLSNAWTSDVKVEVPETGVSIGEMDRLLKSRLGHDVHIGGDLVQTDAGQLALTVRGDGILAKTFTGAPADLGKLTAQAAEYVYGQSQPATFAAYLYSQARNQEAVAFATAAFPRLQDPEEKAYLLNSWAIALQNTGAPALDGLPLLQNALKLKPDYWVAYANVSNAQLMLGREEDAWRTIEAMRKKAGGRPGRTREVLYQNSDLLTWNLLAWRAGLIEDETESGGIGTTTTANGPSIADIDARLHDAADAEFQLRTVQADPHDASIAAIDHFVRGRLAAEAGDVQRAATEMEAFGVAFADPEVSSNYSGYDCWIAPAEEAAGRPDKADAVLKAAGRHVDCYRFQGDILAHRGDWAGAEKAYAAAVALAPDLPAVYYSWGVALARHGQLADAIAKLEAAHAKGPHWADPLKAWGDVLAQQGHWSAAMAKYDQALKYAPAWAGLQKARATAAARA